MADLLVNSATAPVVAWYTGALVGRVVEGVSGDIGAKPDSPTLVAGVAAGLQVAVNVGVAQVVARGPLRAFFAADPFGATTTMFVSMVMVSPNLSARTTTFVNGSLAALGLSWIDRRAPDEAAPA